MSEKSNNKINLLILEQYNKAFLLIESIIKKCKDDIWNNKELDPIISQIVYHILYFSDKYLNTKEEKNNKIKNNLGSDKFGKHSNDIFEKETLMRYLEGIKQKSELRIINLSLTELDEPSLYNNVAYTNLSLILYNLRHIMLHIGAINERLNHLIDYPLICINVDSFRN